MRPFEVADEDRAAYHAAASIASNFLVALEGAAEQLRRAGRGSPTRGARAARPRTRRELGERGADALTGPIARGDAATVARQREADRRPRAGAARAVRRARGADA